MPDFDQIKQGEQGARDRRGRFPKGKSGPTAVAATTSTATREGAECDSLRARLSRRRSLDCASAQRTEIGGFSFVQPISTHQ